ncbi:MAG: hypothetical protein HC895_04940 [Leptolyngbyaceae cyanobacterium SM1_3_5]|nr:hypothetical protein [Leptolyngbyaceae cyanobacterium SM1_3_5]
MKSTWKSIYPGIKAAVVDLDSIDALLRQTVRSIASAFCADCLLWTAETPPRLYASQGWWTELEQTAMALPLGTIDSAAIDVRLYEAKTIPSWLTQHLQPIETPEGDLLVPIPLQPANGDQLRFVLQIRRPPALAGASWSLNRSKLSVASLKWPTAHCFGAIASTSPERKPL